MQAELRSSITEALKKPPTDQFPIHTIQDIETSCKAGESVLIRSMAKTNMALWSLAIVLPIVNLIAFLPKKIPFTADQTLEFFIFVNALVVGIYLPLHVFLRRTMKKHVFVVSREGIYAMFQPYAIRLRAQPPRALRFSDFESLIESDLRQQALAKGGWIESFIKWQDIAEIREELMKEKSWGKSSSLRWPIFQITDASTQVGEIRDRMRESRGRWEFFITSKQGSLPINMYLDIYPVKQGKDFESLLLLSYLVNYYWRSSKQQQGIL